MEDEIERIKKKLKRNCDCDECNIERARLPLLEVLSESLTPKEARGIIQKLKSEIKGYNFGGEPYYPRGKDIEFGNIKKLGVIEFLTDLFTKKGIDVGGGKG